ncbi:MAG: hypothetical protein WBJ45_06785 [Limnohabitans sp.]|uniref:hypothetical protein n=1 Tax=Limnohabitans sp. TaxID=1907725 RepID=UPI003BAFF154
MAEEGKRHGPPIKSGVTNIQLGDGKYSSQRKQIFELAGLASIRAGGDSYPTRVKPKQRASISGFDNFLHFETPNLLQRNKNTRTIANRRAFLHAPFVSSTL